MKNADLVKKLIENGFDATFAKKAVTWASVRFSTEFIKSLKDPLKFIKDNEYQIRQW